MKLFSTAALYVLASLPFFLVMLRSLRPTPGAPAFSYRASDVAGTPRLLENPVDLD